MPRCWSRPAIRRNWPPRLRRLHDSPGERERLGAAAWDRVQERFAWPAVARAIVAQYYRARKERRPAHR